MKKALLLSAMVGLAAANVQADSAQKLETQEQKVSYSFGLIFGKRMNSDIPELEVDLFVQGLKDGFGNKPPLLTEEQMATVMQEYQQSQKDRQMKQFEVLANENKMKGEAFLSENANKEGVVTLESGLQYKVLKEGEGKNPTATDMVSVHYTGSLIDGTVFDSSVQRNQPVSFPVNGVIAGWTEALQMMKPGSKWQLFIPADLAYGPGGNRNIGPNEVLLFDVELLGVEKAPAAPTGLNATQ